MEPEHWLALGQNSEVVQNGVHVGKKGGHPEQKQRDKNISTNSYLKTFWNDKFLPVASEESKHYYKGKQQMS